MMAVIGVREEGAGRTGVDCGEVEYSKYETLCTVGGKYERVRSPGGGEVYVCARDRRMRCSMADDTDEKRYGTG